MLGDDRRAREHAVVSLVLLLGLFACGEGEEACPARLPDSEIDCTTTQDCVSEGRPQLQCVSGRCLKPCISDGDCVVEVSMECRAEQGEPAPAICEAQLCRVACPEAACPAGQICQGGRCVVAYEGFEVQAGAARNTLADIGWNALPTGPDRLANPRLRIAESGPAGCPLGTPLCAGRAASGERFALIGREPARLRGLPELGPTCRPCACCLTCLANPYTMSHEPAACPVGAEPPALAMCPATLPSACEGVCAACDRCPSASGRGSGAGLLACEARAAARTCPSCPSCDDAACGACREASCGDECMDGLDTEACRSCEARSCPACGPCRDCRVCEDAAACAREAPETNACRQRIGACATLGTEGCFPTPLGYRRSELTALEQSLVSPELDLSGQGGALVLSFSYVPFGVGLTYRESREGVPPAMWPEVMQEVVVELCGADCASESAWQEGALRAGGRAAIPPPERRDEGLPLGGQSLLDWRTGQVDVLIPEALRTSSFRFRFRPRLGPAARVGVDDIRVRTLP